MKRDRNYLIQMYNATSEGNVHDGIESYEEWLERQLISRIEKLEEASENQTKAVHKALEEAAEKASNPELDEDDMHAYLNNGLFSKGYDTACRANKESILSLKEKY